mmetsp:Transcript_53930/g.86322  ORF Transcript_53930/g.86322 Transcript_53930/m.86322 type:complete len:218 (-) Transcript_53930:540-1193(-)
MRVLVICDCVVDLPHILVKIVHFNLFGAVSVFDAAANHNGSRVQIGDIADTAIRSAFIHRRDHHTLFAGNIEQLHRAQLLLRAVEAANDSDSIRIRIAAIYQRARISRLLQRRTLSPFQLAKRRTVEFQLHDRFRRFTEIHAAKTIQTAITLTINDRQIFILFSKLRQFAVISIDNLWFRCLQHRQIAAVLVRRISAMRFPRPLLAIFLFFRFLLLL